MITLTLAKTQTCVIHSALFEYVDYMDKQMETYKKFGWSTSPLEDRKKIALNLLEYMHELYKEEPQDS